MRNYFTQLWQRKDTNELAIRRAQELIENLGHGLPCRVTAVAGQLVTVTWQMNTAPWTLPSVTIPCAGQSPWNYRPTQVGDTGVAISASVLLGQIIGTSTGFATFRKPGNLSALMFLPLGTKAFVAPNANAYLIQGPDGAIMRVAPTQGSTTSSVVTDSTGTTVTMGSTTISATGSAITLTAGGKTMTIDSSGITIDGVLFETHTHSAGTYVAGSTAVTGDSGDPI